MAYTEKQLVAILSQHRLWIEGDEKGTRANLSGANLSGANLSGANLSGANLSSANLRGAYLIRANLSDANLRGANLSDANLSSANLSDANLRGANLSDANLSSANLRGAYLIRANLSDAYLIRANLSDANLSDANLRGALLPCFQIPQDGELIVYKKLVGGVVCKLRIPPEAKRTASLIGRKCRAEFAEVLEGEGTARFDQVMAYVAGKTVRPDKYDPDIRVECSHGIHFFLTREEAEAWL